MKYQYKHPKRLITTEGRAFNEHPHVLQKVTDYVIANPKYSCDLEELLNDICQKFDLVCIKKEKCNLWQEFVSTEVCFGRKCDEYFLTSSYSCGCIFSIYFCEKDWQYNYFDDVLEKRAIRIEKHSGVKK